MVETPLCGNCGLRGLVHAVADIIGPASRDGRVISREITERPARKPFVVPCDKVQSAPPENPPECGLSIPVGCEGNGGSPPLITSTPASRSTFVRKNRFTLSVSL